MCHIRSTGFIQKGGIDGPYPRVEPGVTLSVRVLICTETFPGRCIIEKRWRWIPPTRGIWRRSQDCSRTHTTTMALPTFCFVARSLSCTFFSRALAVCLSLSLSLSLYLSLYLLSTLFLPLVRAISLSSLLARRMRGIWRRSQDCSRTRTTTTAPHTFCSAARSVSLSLSVCVSL